MASWMDSPRTLNCPGNAFHCNINGSLLLEIGEVLKSSGMLKAGYASVNIDDCWPLRQRDAAGNIVPDPAKFRTSTFDAHQQSTAAGIFLGVLLDRLRVAGYSARYGRLLQVPEGPWCSLSTLSSSSLYPQLPFDLLCFSCGF